MSRPKKAQKPSPALPHQAAPNGRARAGASTASSAADDEVPDDLSLPDSGALVHHPDGWYWLDDDGRQQFGPYATSDEALAEMHAAGEEAIEPAESLLEAELEIGISDWLDPDTGEPAEGMHTRIEDH